MLFYGAHFHLQFAKLAKKELGFTFVGEVHYPSIITFSNTFKKRIYIDGS